MIIARWHIDACFGHKQDVIDALKTWCRDIAIQIGWTADKVRIATGSIGALESIAAGRPATAYGVEPEFAGGSG